VIRPPAKSSSGMTAFAIGDRVKHKRSGRSGVIMEFSDLRSCERYGGQRVRMQWDDQAKGCTEWRWLSVMVSWGALAFLAALSVGT